MQPFFLFMPTFFPMFDQKSIIHWQDPRKFFVQPKFWKNFETALFKYIHSRVCRKLLTSPAKSSPLDLFPSCQWKDTTWFPRRTFHLYYYDLSLRNHSRIFELVRHETTYVSTLRSLIEGYTCLLVFRKFSSLPAVIWASPFINFQENF